MKSINLNLIVVPAITMALTLTFLVWKSNREKEPSQKTGQPNPDSHTNPSSLNTAANTPQILFQTRGGSIMKIVNPASGLVGTGFFIETTRGANLLTNKHLVENARGILVLKEPCQKMKTPAGWIATSAVLSGTADLAIVELKLPEGIQPIPLENDRKVQPGTPILTMGYPLGGNLSVQEGLISSIDQETFTFSAPLSQGGSGSPVLNEAGKAIGIAFGFIESAQNHNLALRTSALPKQKGWVRQETKLDPNEKIALEGIITAWENKNPNLMAMIEAHTQEFGIQARLVKESQQNMQEAIHALLASESAVPWGELLLPENPELKIRTLTKFLNLSQKAGEAAAECFSHEGPNVSEQTRAATALAQSADSLAQASIKLVARTQNDSVDKSLTEPLEKLAKSYHSSKAYFKKVTTSP